MWSRPMIITPRGSAWLPMWPAPCSTRAGCWCSAMMRRKPFAYQKNSRPRRDWGWRAAWYPALTPPGWKATSRPRGQRWCGSTRRCIMPKGLCWSWRAGRTPPPTACRSKRGWTFRLPSLRPCPPCCWPVVPMSCRRRRGSLPPRHR